MLRARLQRSLESVWYGGAPVPIVLALLERVYRFALAWRRRLYASGWKRSVRVAVPVLVVGNLTVGGTGKTPLVVWLLNELHQRGWNAGVVTRGYGGSERGPMLVPADAEPARYGDEALLIARAGNAPVAIARRRSEGARLLLEHGCDLVIADDGLQHWALARDLEIVVVDAQRRFGNGRLLPAGPLREPVSRLARVDFVVANGAAEPGEVAMRVEGHRAVRLDETGRSRPLTEFGATPVHAIAGIGNPERFFTMLEAHGLRVVRHPLDDHHVYAGDELRFDDELPVLVTEKDAVKCARFAHDRVWVVPAEASLPAEFADRVHASLHALRRSASA